jgi:hypothetical protein
MTRFGDIFSRGLAGMAMMLLLGACAGTGGPTVAGNYDPATDFSQFSTFGFAQPLGSDDRRGRTSVSVRLITATARELQSRDLIFVDNNPDLMINFFLQETTGVPTSNMSVSNSPFSHAHGGASTWRGYDMSRSTASQITEGTLVVDVFDTRRNMLVFEGFAQNRVTEGTRDQLAETINDAIASIFETFPSSVKKSGP